MATGPLLVRRAMLATLPTAFPPRSRRGLRAKEATCQERAEQMRRVLSCWCPTPAPPFPGGQAPPVRQPPPDHTHSAW